VSRAGRPRGAALGLALLLLGACADAEPEWLVADPGMYGLDGEELALAVEGLADLGYVRSLTVTRRGDRVVHAALAGTNVDSVHDVRSTSKSLLSAMVGIAVDDGLLSLDDRILSFFPQHEARVVDDRVGDITVEHLLQMRGGLPGDLDTYFDLHESSDWIAATLSQRLVSDPGEELHYTTFGTHLLSGALAAASGGSTLDFAQRQLCEPAGMHCGPWETDPQGLSWGGNAMQLTSADMARFGQLYAQDGEIDGTRVVPASWVATSTASQADVGPEWGPWRDIGYADLWWLGTLDGHDLVFALGHGGQYIIIDRDGDLVITTSATWQIGWDAADAHERAIAEVISAHVLGAMID
jgi:CubicO group peptidase (beta-lactamase class C family)